jgi:excisionase family DNA binding protein
MVFAMTSDPIAVLSSRPPSHSPAVGDDCDTKSIYRPGQATCPELSGPMLTVAEVADILRVSVKTIRRMVEAGTLMHSRFGRVVRISREDLRHCINAARE